MRHPTRHDSKRNTHTHTLTKLPRTQATQFDATKSVVDTPFLCNLPLARLTPTQPNPTSPLQPSPLLLLLLLLPPHNANCTKAKNNISTVSGAWIPRLPSTPTPNQPACKLVKSSSARKPNTSRFGPRFEASTQCTAQPSPRSRPFLEEWNARVFCESPKLEPRWWLAKRKGRRKEVIISSVSRLMMVMMDVCRVRASPPLPPSQPPGQLGGPPGESPGMADGQCSQNHSSQAPPQAHTLHLFPPFAPWRGGRVTRWACPPAPSRVPRNGCPFSEVG
jgi:hypothetical protein